MVGPAFVTLGTHLWSVCVVTPGVQFVVFETYPGVSRIASAVDAEAAAVPMAVRAVRAVAVIAATLVMRRIGIVLLSSCVDAGCRDGLRRGVTTIGLLCVFQSDSNKLL